MSLFFSKLQSIILEKTRQELNQAGGHIPYHSQRQRKQTLPCLLTGCLCPAFSLHFYTVQGSVYEIILPTVMVVLHTSINIMISADKFMDIFDLANSSLRPSSRVMLDCVELTVKTNHCTNIK